MLETIVQVEYELHNYVFLISEPLLTVLYT